jgi:hypothetical protein
MIFDGTSPKGAIAAERSGASRLSQQIQPAGSSGAALVGEAGDRAGGVGPDVDDYGGDYLGHAAAGADQLGAVVVAVGAGRHLEQHVAVADGAAQFAFRHGWLLSSEGEGGITRM